MDNGVLYVGIDDKYFEQAIASADSVSKYNPNLRTAIITTEKMKKKKNCGNFDEIVISEKEWNDVRDKSFNLDKSPFDKTLYMDGDTLVTGDISPVFSLLDRVDIAAAHSTHKELITIDNIPETLPEFNTGVLAYNNDKNVHDFIKTWNECLSKQIKNGRPHSDIPVESGDSLEEIKAFGRKTDQPPFREALYKSDIEFSTLPDEYNFGAWGRSYAYNDVKIIHGRDYRRGLLNNKINLEKGQRIYLEGLIGKVYYKSGETINIFPKHIRAINFIIRKLKLVEVAHRTNTVKYSRKLYNIFKDWSLRS